MRYCDFCQELTKPTVHRVYAKSDYYFCKKHETWGPLGILEEVRLDELNQEGAKKCQTRSKRQGKT